MSQNSAASSPNNGEITQVSESRPQTPPPPPPPIDDSILHTPHVRHLQKYHTHSMAPVDIAQLRNWLVQETRGQYIGNIDPYIFAEEFMGWNPDIDDAFKTEKPSKARLARLIGMATKPESAMYDDWQGAISGWPFVRKRKTVRRLDFDDTHSHRDASSLLGPDNCIYDRKNPIVPRFPERKVDFSNILCFAEFKAKETMDAFVDAGSEEYDGDAYYQIAGYSEPKDDAEEDELEEDNGVEAVEEYYVAESPKSDVVTGQEEDEVGVDVDTDPSPSKDYPFENDTKQGRNTRGQIASYAGVTMAMQFRSHLFSVLICGKYARFIRWDRSSAIVTRRFDYTAHPLILFDFYKRFAQLNDVQRGLYPNISKLSKKDGMTALEILRHFATTYFTGQRPDSYEKELDPKQLPLLRMVFDDNVYVVPAPHFDGAMYSPFGRCTRNRAVVHLRLAAVHYFKDYWREYSLYTKKESDIYHMLDGKVKFVAKMHAGGDLMTGDGMNAEAVITVGHRHISDPWVQNPGKLRIRELTAHFVLLSTMGRDLATFSTARQLVSCIADAMEAHQQAYKLGILHRDISAGNILMSLEPENREGILVDWDHCILLNGAIKDRTDTRVHRTGTWQFMSAYLTMNPLTASHTVVDDRESALHVLVYMALKYLRHDVPDQQDLRGILHIFDDYMAQEGQPDKGLRSKQFMIERGGPGVKFLNLPVTTLIQTLAEFFAPRYVDKYGTPVEELSLPEPRASRYQRDRDEHLERLADLFNPESEFVYETLRHFARILPEPATGVTQWVDNLKPTGAALKRTRGDHEMSHRQKMMLRWDGLVTFKTGDTYE